MYSYGSLFPKDLAEAAISMQAERAYLMNTSFMCAWEPANDWSKALDSYFPLFADKGAISGIVTTNVPFMFPVPAFGDEYYKAVPSQQDPTRNVIVFRPREWRGTNASGAPPFSGHQYLTVPEMAAEVNGYKSGTVTGFYLTTDGGFTIQNLFDLVAQLLEHVQVVTGSQLVDMARQRESTIAK
jgi:hypothetical protein